MLCGNTAFQFIAHLPSKDSSILNLYGDVVHNGRSASAQRSLII